ncbi:MAG TPA: hypothetical protein DHW82_06170 [Spirochaetia bacterium]|nr:MAG: hypothetical protein A2Y41_09950 [Spirochaetes bacterium GWB1_36_13]HCL56578.1 hypothetical protein [Spirochaetia bacterium]
MFLSLILLFNFSSISFSPIQKAEQFQEWIVRKAVGQMLIFGFEGKKEKDPGVQNAARHLRKAEIGGILLFGNNVSSKKQLALLIQFLKKDSVYPFFISVDQEGGLIQRLSSKNGFKDFPPAEKVAQTMNIFKAFALYSEMAEILSDTGINYNLAPSLDLKINPKNPIIAKFKRSFSQNPVKTLFYAAAFIKAHRENNVLTSIKHFPGHGSSKEDTHLNLTDISGQWQLKELIPFQALISSDLADSIMVSHLMHRKIDPFHPVSLSKIFIGEIIRKYLKYDGVVITDDLEMGAIRKHFSLEEVVVKGISAGSNILLFYSLEKGKKDQSEEIKNLVLKNLKNGSLTLPMIYDSFQKILKLKEKIEKWKKK